MAVTIVPGYQQPWGSKQVAMIDMTGPTSYNNTGTYATSGDTLTASQLGWGGIEMVIAAQSSDGLNEVMVSFAGNQVVPSSVALHWFVTATGAEVANGINLSTKSVRLLVIGV